MPVRHRSIRRASLAVAAGAMLAVVVGSVPALAKMFLEASLDAPISFQSPPGSELLVGVTVTVPEGLEDHAMDGSPIWLVLHGPRGDRTEALGATGPGPEHYTFRIEVPEGGPRRLEVVVRDGAEVPAFLMTDPFTFRPIGKGTAQLAQPIASLAPRAPVAAPAQPAVQPGSAPVAVAPAPVVLAVALVGMGLVAAVAGLVLARSGRRARSVDVPPRAPGA